MDTSYADIDEQTRREATESRFIAGVLETARGLLGMEMAYVADTRGGLQDYLALSGEAESFGASLAEPVPLEGTYCELLLAGELDGLVVDAQADSRVAALPITGRAGIGAYVGVPVELPDGSVFGTFCCLSHDAEPTLRERDLQFMRVLAMVIGEQLYREQELIEHHRVALNDAHVGALLSALEARDGYTGQHSHEVVDLALRVARELDLGPEMTADLRIAALLHDIGKIGISDSILRKPGNLDPEEWQEMHRHPIIGERMIAATPGLGHLAPVIRAEHERWDGGGYPDGLVGDEIPLISRIVFVCDAYHAMTSDRPYRFALTAEVARGVLEAESGKQFCPTTVAAALRVLSGAGSIPLAEQDGRARRDQEAQSPHAWVSQIESWPYRNSTSTSTRKSAA